MSAGPRIHKPLDKGQRHGFGDVKTLPSNRIDGNSDRLFDRTSSRHIQYIAGYGRAASQLENANMTRPVTPQLVLTLPICYKT